MDRLSDPLCNAAMYLAFQHHRIDHRAKIIDHRIPLKVDSTGSRIDFQFSNVTAIGIGRPVRLIAMIDVERMVTALWHQTQHQIFDRDRSVGTLCREKTIDEDQIIRIAIQRLSGMRACLVKRACGHFSNCGTQHCRHPGTACRPVWRDRGVTLKNLDLVGVIAKPVRQDLRQGRAMSLPVFLLCGQHQNGAIITETDLHAAITATAALFQIHAHAKPAQHATAF